MEVAEEDFEWFINVNFWGVVRMTRAFLPQLKASDDARIVTLSSIFGLIAPAGQTAYSASKFAVRGFSNALMQELKGLSVGVTVAHPGGVAKAIAERARMPKTATPEDRRSLGAGKETAQTRPPRSRARRSSWESSAVGDACSSEAAPGRSPPSSGSRRSPIWPF